MNICYESYCKLIFTKCGIDIDFDKVKGESRTADAVYQRALVCHALRLKGESCVSIGKFINRDHSTVTHLIRRYETGKYHNQNFGYVVKMINAHTESLDVDSRIAELEILIRELKILSLQKKLEELNLTP